MRSLIYFEKLIKSDIFSNEFKRLQDEDLYNLAKKQENLIISKFPTQFGRLWPIYDSTIYDNELDLKFGDFVDFEGNYFDLKVGKETNNFCGGIGIKSINEFGNTKTNRHFYLCVNHDFTRGYVINAKKLNQLNTSKKTYLGELDYKLIKKAIIKYWE